jgi:hypothetical protein
MSQRHALLLICLLYNSAEGQRISWLGHLEKIEEDRRPQKIFSLELDGKKRRGKPRKGWREVERDLQVLGVRRWRERW